MSPSAPASPPASPASATPARRARRRNADYRWTVKKVEAFLRALGRCGVVAEAAREVGMGRQSAYRLKARLADPRFQHAFELARRQGWQARMAARAEARVAQSRWGEPGLAAYDYLRGGSRAQGDSQGAQGDGRSTQSDGRSAQGDTRSAQGDRGAPPRPVSGLQGDTFRPQGDGFSRKATF